TSSALVFPTILLLHIFFNANLTILYFIFLGFLGFLFVSKIQIKKPELKGILIMITIGLIEAGALLYVFIVMKKQ
ncbi:MAG: hypothetical protein IKQ84_06260, partial [Spirochaetaceae bacterium]|nr:hypothetical protein [Spirochaetaceae bacterium]